MQLGLPTRHPSIVAIATIMLDNLITRHQIPRFELSLYLQVIPHTI